MTDNNTMRSPEINLLEAKLDELLNSYNALLKENQLLKTKQEELVREKAKLIEKTSTARFRVESMISRLKSMEQGT
jgi:cell division protein ZapB